MRFLLTLVVEQSNQISGPKLPLVLAHYHRMLLPIVRSKLVADSDPAIEAHNALYLFLTEHMSRATQDQHGLIKPEEDWEPMDELGSNPTIIEWDEFGPLKMLRCASSNRCHG